MKIKIVILLLFGLNVWLFYLRDSKTDNKPFGYITVNTGGGQLGNQMFDIAATLAYGWDHHLIPLFPGLNGSGNNLSHNRDRVFFRVDSVTSCPVPLTRYTVANTDFEKLPHGLKNVELDGGFFSWKYFDHHRQEIIDMFAPSESTVTTLRSKYKDLIASDKTVSIHVRTYSKIIHEKGSPFTGLTFFEEAMAKFPDDSLFVVFSDRIEWCKAKFKEKFPNKNLVFIEGNDYVDEFYLMSLMKNHILSRSTFSWWAAYLNRNPEKVVYVPVLYTGLKDQIISYLKKIPSFFGLGGEELFWLPEWKQISFRLEPYPEDIYSYGGESTSVYPLDK